MGTFTGTVPTILPGDIPDGDEWDSITDELFAIADSWTTWSPTNSNITLGSGTVTARYRQVGKTVNFIWKFTLGAGSAVGTGPTFTLPATPASWYTTNHDPIADVILTDTGTSTYRGIGVKGSGSVCALFAFTSTGIVTNISSTVPHTWASTDVISVHGQFEVA